MLRLVGPHPTPAELLAAISRARASRAARASSAAQDSRHVAELISKVLSSADAVSLVFLAMPEGLSKGNLLGIDSATVKLFYDGVANLGDEVAAAVVRTSDRLLTELAQAMPSAPSSTLSALISAPTQVSTLSFPPSPQGDEVVAAVVRASDRLLTELAQAMPSAPSSTLGHHLPTHPRPSRPPALVSLPAPATATTAATSATAGILSSWSPRTIHCAAACFSTDLLNYVCLCFSCPSAPPDPPDPPAPPPAHIISPDPFPHGAREPSAVPPSVQAPSPFLMEPKNHSAVPPSVQAPVESVLLVLLLPLLPLICLLPLPQSPFLMEPENHPLYRRLCKLLLDLPPLPRQQLICTLARRVFVPCMAALVLMHHHSRQASVCIPFPTHEATFEAPQKSPPVQAAAGPPTIFVQVIASLPCMALHCCTLARQVSVPPLRPSPGEYLSLCMALHYCTVASTNPATLAPSSHEHPLQSVSYECGHLQQVVETALHVITIQLYECEHSTLQQPIDRNTNTNPSVPAPYSPLPPTSSYDASAPTADVETAQHVITIQLYEGPPPR
ncbi:unnamed protein product [Closterium sp. NIES-65]|nr:unnamed protein product [Closterium sp. NIES-65]